MRAGVLFRAVLDRDMFLCGLTKREFFAHFFDDSSIVGLPKNSGACNEGIGAGLTDRADVVDLDAAIHLKRDGLSARLHVGINECARLPKFIERAWNKTLTPIAWVD